MIQLLKQSTGGGLRFVFLALCAAFIAEPVRAAAPYDIEVRENVEYGQAGEESLTLHLARPTNAPSPAPAIAFIHGGGWRMGSKNDHLREIKLAAEQGFVAVSVGYRLAPEHKFPAQIQDCKCAIRWLRAHADKLQLDPERIGAVGGSAGGHLSMLLGTVDEAPSLEGNSGWADQPSKVQAVVSFFGPADIVDEYRYSSNARALAALVKATGGDNDKRPIRGAVAGANAPTGSDVSGALDEAGRTVTDFMGGTPRELPEEYRLASPLEQVDSRDAPMLIFHGTRDLLVPWKQSIDMARKLTEAGVPGRVEIVAGAGHGFAPDDQQRAVRATLDFFAEQLKLERE